ncbi:MAG TPA: hypothetical protein VNP97_00360, partial [Microbacterium sp.]|nr:hypothetical protein [Microbacterium sp.]
DLAAASVTVNPLAVLGCAPEDGHRREASTIMDRDQHESAQSDTANEYENPGANYPDREDTAGIQPEEDEARSDAVADGAASSAPDTAAALGENTQDGPVLSQNQATVQEKIDGILAQTRIDLAAGAEPVERYEEVLRQRFIETGIDVPADQVHAFAERLAAD